jgi:cytochrome c oxidase assembly factor CtaG
MTTHMLEHLALTLVLAPALAAGAAARLRVPPLVALLQFAIVVAVLHVPLVWDAVHERPLLRVGADLLTLASATCFWWPALAVASPLGPIGRTAYLMVGMPLMSLPGVLLDFVDHPLYRGVSLGEQHRAGALMWGVGSAMSAAVLVVGVWASLVREERSVAGAGA